MASTDVPEPPHQCEFGAGHEHVRTGDPGVTAIVPFLRQLSDHMGDGLSAVTPATAAGTTGPAGGESGSGPGTSDGLERMRLDAERQILLTMLLAHMCSEHDATPRTFVEQVLRLYEAQVLDSIQFLFDLGFVPRVASNRNPTDRTAVTEAVRRQMDSGGRGDPLLLGAWPRGEASAGAAATGRERGVSGAGGGARGKKGIDENTGGATTLGIRVLSSSRYLRDFEEEGLIARGSFGDVYRTRHRLDGTRYAIKKVVFRGEGLANPRAEAVMREVQCLAQLDHKNIVRYHTSWLESSWVENGMGRGQHGARGAGAAVARAAGGPEGAADGVRMAAMARALAAASGGTATTEDGDQAHNGSLRARMDALVPAHMQPQLIKGLESMVRSGDSASESGSGWGWGWGGDVEPGFCGAGTGKTACRHGTVARGGSLLRGNRGGDRRGSMSPQVRSPKSLLFSQSARDRGFSRWSAEELESETSRWSDISSCAGGDWDEELVKSRGTGVGLESSGISRVHGAGGVPARSSSSRWVPPVVRKPRSDQCRNPSIDMDDLVSFGDSSPTGCDSPTWRGAEDARDNSEGWREWGAANSVDTLGGGVGRVGRRGSTDCGGRGLGGEQRWARKSLSPARLVQYPVTLYIQMNLCPRDTLQDWLCKRNAKLSSEAEIAGHGVLFEDNTHSPSKVPVSTYSPLPGSHGRRSAPTASADVPAAIGVLQNPSMLADGAKTHVSLASSPRTDPVTSASSGGSDDRSENSSIGGNGDETPLDGMLCPPPTRETSGELYSGGAMQGFATRAKERKDKKMPKTDVSPARSVTSDSDYVCEGKGLPGTGRTDLHEALGLFRQLVEGVAHIHSKGIIHRDIKPENVFMGEDGCLKIGDFGLSRTEAPADDDTAASMTHKSDPLLEAAIVVPRPARGDDHTTGVGTASYASPEQLQGRQYGVRSDLFSLGLILLELCCRFTTTHERADAFHSMRHPDGAAPAHLVARSPAVARLAELLCRTVPKQRPSAEEVLDRLDALQGSCGCNDCPGSGGRNGVSCQSEGAGDVRLREELAAKTRKVEEQEVLIGQLQRKLSELSRNPSPAIGPVNSGEGHDEQVFDMEALGLGLAALGRSPISARPDHGVSPGRVVTTDGREVAAEYSP